MGGLSARNMIRKKTTKELLGESIQELAKQKPVDKITVKEIVDNCNLSPATFYRHFHDKFELIAWIYNYQMEDLFLDYCSGAEGWRQVLLDMVNILDRDRDFYRNALINTCGQNSFFLATHIKGVELLTSAISAEAGDAADEELLFDVRFYLRGVSYSVIDWFLNDSPASVEQLAECLYRAMPERLKPHLRERQGGEGR